MCAGSPFLWISEVRWDLWGFIVFSYNPGSPKSLLLRSVFRWFFEYLQGQRLYNLSGLLSYPHGKCFLMFREQICSPLLQFMSLPSASVIAQHWKEPSFMFFLSFLQVYIHLYIQFICMRKILCKPFLGLSHSSLSLSLYERCLSAWISRVALYPSCTEEPKPKYSGFCFAGKCRHDYLIYKSWCCMFRTRKGSVRGPADSRKSLQ